MSNALAIAGTTAVLYQILNNVFASTTFGSVTVTALAPAIGSATSIAVILSSKGAAVPRASGTGLQRGTKNRAAVFGIDEDQCRLRRLAQSAP